MDKNIVNWTKIREQGLAIFLLKNNFEKINYFESDSTFTYLVLEDGSKVQVDIYLHQLEKVLPPAVFYRCGWSYLVNLNKVREYWMLEYPFLVMSNGNIIPISPPDKLKVKKALRNKVEIIHE